MRPRKFYATRHTFISLTLMAGVVKLKRLADYCGTSIEMIENHYAKWMGDDRPEELAALGGSAPRAGDVGARGGRAADIEPLCQLSRVVATTVGHDLRRLSPTARAARHVNSERPFSVWSRRVSGRFSDAVTLRRAPLGGC
jgi:hypothetical protein